MAFTWDLDVPLHFRKWSDGYRRREIYQTERCEDNTFAVWATSNTSDGWTERTMPMKVKDLDDLVKQIEAIGHFNN